MFIRVKSKATGHEFDIHETRFDEAKHTRVDKRKYPPSKRFRPTKFKAPLGAVSISTDVEEGAGDADDSSSTDNGR